MAYCYVVASKRAVQMKYNQFVSSIIQGIFFCIAIVCGSILIATCQKGGANKLRPIQYAAAASIDVAGLGIYYLPNGVGCLKGQPGKMVRKKGALQFEKLSSYYARVNKGNPLSAKQKGTLKASQATCKSLSKREVLYVDGNLKRSCPEATYNPLKRVCSKGKARAFKTVIEALANIEPGDYLTIRGAKNPYRAFQVNNVGLPEARITLQNFAGETPYSWRSE